MFSKLNINAMIFKNPIRTIYHNIRNCSGPKCWTKPDYGPVEVQRSEMLNGIKLAAAKPMGAQLGACTIMYQAGSRFENACTGELGATHFIRAASTTTSCSYTGFMKMRVLQQYGAALHVTSDRQFIAYTLKCPITSFKDLQYYLLDSAVRCRYKEWEIDDLRSLISEDLQRISPEQRALDLAQQACWRGSLQNSLYCEPELVKDITGETLNQFTYCNYKTDHCTVASLGIPYEDTLKLAENIDHRREKPLPMDVCPSYPRAGFAYHDLGPNSETWICLVVPGCGTSDFDGLLRHAILAAACGTDYIEMGSHWYDHIAETPLGDLAEEDPYTNYRAFNISYVDTGVFGVLAKTRACSAWQVSQKAADFMKKIGDLKAKHIEIGKKRLKLNLAIHDDVCTRVTEGLALQLANNVRLDSAADTMALVDAIAPEAVLETAKLLSKNCHQMAVAVVGDVGQVPHDKLLRP